jgi:hypothetical protein
MCVCVVDRHHCWAADPLGLGFPVSIYCSPPLCNSVCGPAPLLGCRPIRVRVESLYICVPHLLSIQHFHTSTWYQTRLGFLPPPTHSRHPALGPAAAPREAHPSLPGAASLLPTAAAEPLAPPALCQVFFHLHHLSHGTSPASSSSREHGLPPAAPPHLSTAALTARAARASATWRGLRLPGLGARARGLGGTPVQCERGSPGARGREARRPGPVGPYVGAAARPRLLRSQHARRRPWRRAQPFPGTGAQAPPPLAPPAGATPAHAVGQAWPRRGRPLRGTGMRPPTAAMVSAPVFFPWPPGFSLEAMAGSTSLSTRDALSSRCSLCP